MKKPAAPRHCIAVPLIAGHGRSGSARAKQIVESALHDWRR